MTRFGRRARGLALAVSWLSVLPVPVRGEADRGAGGRALRWAPVVGLGLGAAAAGVLAGLDAVHAPPLLAGLLVVAALAGATRAMHLDGLADTADGLGCYGGPRRALEVMRDGSVGPFGVVVLVLVLGVQASSIAALVAGSSWWPAAVAVLVAVAAGRVAMEWCARRGVAPARPDGLGALVAGTQPRFVPLLWTTGLLAGAVWAVPERPWQGPLAVLAAAAVVVALSARTRRRFGGVTGDVLGAASELTTTVVLTGCALGS